MTRCIIGLLLLAISGVAYGGETASMRKNCRLEYPSNIYKKQACYDRHKASRRELVKLRRNGKAKIVNDCIRANPGAVAGTDWSGALWCTRETMKAARRK